jgi:hypothetical protein
MSDHARETDARGGRRRFLRTGVSLAGAFSIGSVLAACGASATQTPAEHGGELAVAATSLQTFLVIARYSREKWIALGESKQEQAHETAEVVFPEEEPEIRQLPLDSEGVPVLRSFHTGIFATLKEQIASDTSQRTPSQIVDEIMTTWRPPSAEVTDPGIGWVAMIEADRFPAFVERMGGRQGPLWQMYDIEVIPLNGDRTTKDVYDFMTPVSWNK